MKQYRVGELRPSQILFSFGIGANVDLPNLAVLVMGLDRWRLERAEEIHEARLLRAVQRQLGFQVERLYAPPAVPSEQIRSPLDEAARVGIPVSLFPRWLRCPRCNQIAPVDSGLFELKDPYRADAARYVHVNCAKMTGNKPPTVVPVRFIVACRHGHMDDFPWVEYVHRGNTHCNGVLRLSQYGVSDAVTDVMVQCDQCQANRRLVDAFGKEAEDSLPKCRGHHPHLGLHHQSECRETNDVTGQTRPMPIRTLLLGASNSWFPILLSALAVPEGAKNRLAQLVEDHWIVLQAAANREVLVAFRTIGQLNTFADYSDDDLWAAIEAKRNAAADTEAEDDDLKRPEWLVFANPDPGYNNEDFRLETVPVPPGYEGYFAKVVLATRLREVRALTGFTRIESPGEFGEEWQVPGERRAPLSNAKPTWVPAVEVRGEGIFIEFQEQVLAAWCRSPSAVQREQEFREAHWQWRHARGLTPESEGFPGIRYVLLHSFAHALMRQLALECGYTSASIRERIYARDPGEEGGPMAGVLIYTAAADSEGTLGGLVAQGHPQILARHLDQALEQMALCTSDPLCADHHPHHKGTSLHGAACHACQFAPETSCERGNKYLDRSLLVTTLSIESHPFFKNRASSPGDKTGTPAKTSSTPEVQWALPEFLIQTADGVPIYRLDDLVGDRTSAPVPRCKVAVGGVPEASFIIQIEAPTMEAYKVNDEINRLAPGRWALFIGTEADDYDRTVQLLIHRTGIFKATGKAWTVGRPTKLVRDHQSTLVNIVYASQCSQCRPEKVAATDVFSLGRLLMVYDDRIGDWRPV